MHSIESSTGRYSYHFNSDLSGEILVIDKVTAETVAEIPGCDMRRLVANWVMVEKISRLEQMDYDEILLS